MLAIYMLQIISLLDIWAVIWVLELASNRRSSYPAFPEKLKQLVIKILKKGRG